MPAYAKRTVTKRSEPADTVSRAPSDILILRSKKKIKKPDVSRMEREAFQRKHPFTSV